MGWKTGLSEHPWDAPPFYVLISVSMFCAMVANFFRINPVKALFWSQLLAGVLTIPILLFILLLANNRAGDEDHQHAFAELLDGRDRWARWWARACSGAGGRGRNRLGNVGDAGLFEDRAQSGLARRSWKSALGAGLARWRRACYKS